MQSARKPGDRPDVNANGAAGAGSGDHFPVTLLPQAMFNIINAHACGWHAMGKS